MKVKTKANSTRAFGRHARIACGASLLVATVAMAQTVSFDAVLEIAKNLGAIDLKVHPQLEKAEPNELRNIGEIALNMFQIQMATEPQSRDAHAKGHGCAHAEFEVEKNIPKELQSGIFAKPGEKFGAIIRYSNGSGKTAADAIPDGRGMAIKLIGAAKQGNILGTGNTQDFLLINSPRFFVGTIKDYALLQDAALKDRKLERFFVDRVIREALAAAGRADAETISHTDPRIVQIMVGIQKAATDSNALVQAVASAFPEEAPKLLPALGLKLAQMQKGEAPLDLKIAKEVARSIGSSLSESYFSMSAYLLRANQTRKDDTAVKYIARPVQCDTGEMIQPEKPGSNPSNDLLSEKLAADLKSAPRCYQFFVQTLPTTVNTETRLQLVEDARRDFNTPEILVAKITIPAQDIATPERKQYCQNLSFNPWQAAPEHQPLGAMNRARKLAVTASSIRRHCVTGADRKEPTTVEEYKNLP